MRRNKKIVPQTKENLGSSNSMGVVNEGAVQWARERSDAYASVRPRTDELIAYEELWRTIADGLADKIGNREIVASLVAIGYTREAAKTLVHASIAEANSMASLKSYRQARDRGVNIKKKWLSAATSCEICKANNAQGPIDLDELFQSGHLATPGCLNCNGAIASVVER